MIDSIYYAAVIVWGVLFAFCVYLISRLDKRK